VTPSVIVKPTPKPKPRVDLVLFPLALSLLALSSCASQSPVPVAPTAPEGDCTWVPPDPDVPAREADGAVPPPPAQECAAGTADCDSDTANGCEVVLADDPGNCGGCGKQCAYPQATGGCVGGACRLVGCWPGYVDKDRDPKNGCEQLGVKPVKRFAP
jgi:hypothetical protein